MGSAPRYRVRAFTPGDAQSVARLFADYMRETYAAPSAMTPDVLLRDGQGRHFRLLIAVDSADAPIGFAAWREDYDLHNVVSGAYVPDLFVSRPYRGRAVSLRLVSALARIVRQQGGVYLKSEVLTEDAGRMRLARRLTVGYPGEHIYLSGRAFRDMSELAEADPRTIARNLPAVEANREP